MGFGSTGKGRTLVGAALDCRERPGRASFFDDGDDERDDVVEIEDVESESDCKSDSKDDDDDEEEDADEDAEADGEAAGCPFATGRSRSFRPGL